MRGPKLAILLAVAAIAVAAQNYVFFSSLADAPGAVESELDDALDGADPTQEILALSAIDAPELAAWLADQAGPARSPFLTRSEAEALGESRSPLMPRLSGTLWSPQRRVAWLDGRPHSEGDWVGRHRITRIGRTGVVLQSADASLELALGTPTQGSAEENEDAR